MPPPPKTLAEFIDALREGLVCDRCGKYVGSLAKKRYLPPPYPVALDGVPDDEVQALIAFEWHMLDRLQRGNFTIRHPQRDGHCVTFREWLADDDEEDDEDTEDSA